MTHHSLRRLPSSQSYYLLDYAAGRNDKERRPDPEDAAQDIAELFDEAADEQDRWARDEAR